ncbi:MAG: 50S ribosomal protein L23 [Oscillospiraceae bacterium]|nr:50S ribosomal protein L23 [Oscillospiraceae bacterium]
MKMTSYDLIRKPVITEKTMKEMQQKKYTFIVDKKSNKFQIKKALEEVFDITIDEVKTMNYFGKPKRVRYQLGRRPDFKKAIIKLKQGSKGIAFFEGMQ